MKWVSVLLFWGVLLFHLALPTARAADEAPSRPPVKGDWSARVGVLGSLQPDYRGAATYESQGYPLIELEWRDKAFLNLRNGLGFWAWQTPRTRVGAAVGYIFGRDEEDAPELEGLGDVEDGLTANLWVEHALGPLAGTVRYRQQVSGEHTGFVVRAGASLRRQRVSGFFLTPGLDITLADADFMAAYYGVDRRQAARSGYPPYTPRGGIEAVGVRLSAFRSLFASWGLQILVHAERLIGDAASSPLVRSREQFRLAAGLVYAF